MGFLYQSLHWTWDGLGGSFALPLAAFSPDDRKVAFFCGLPGSHRVQLFNVMTQKLEHEFEEPDQAISFRNMISFSPEGSYFAYNTEGIVHLCSAKAGEKLYSILLPAGIYESEFSPCNTGICFATRRGHYYLNAFRTSGSRVL